MKISKLDIPVTSHWIENNERRLDCNPYLSGAFEAKVILNKLPVKKEPLQELTKEGMKGIFNGPRFSRNYVNNPDYGVPFLGSTDILAADLSNLPLLSKKKVTSCPELLIDEGWTLITCSGTIGRMVYSRSDMKGMAGSQHFMRVVPDPDKILPGYLYAYLSSRFGLPIVVSGTYGAIIQHIEPRHIADLPVPRLGEDVERKVHELIDEAARIRTEANIQLTSTIEQLEDILDLPHLPRNFEKTEPDVSTASSKLLTARFDGLFHSNYHKSALEPLLNLPESMRTTVGLMADDVFEPTRFKRIPLDNTEYGIPFFGTSALMWLEPAPTYYIPKKMTGIEQYIVDEKTLLIPRSGQLAGIIGHAVFPHGSVLGGTVTEDAIRIKVKSQTIAGYLFIALSSEYGRRQLKARAFGSSIPHLDVRMIKETVIPLLSDEQISKIGVIGHRIAQARSEAIEKEQQARKLVENAISKGGV
ncbi:restriction endonuclease S subunit [Rivularia sp. PCC 7116]|uniref:methylation-associated defense system restriction endonuclease subunit S MAD5 n=1 Tax=Rivularia sp. PCC 7116 TaxID=373994 RepID=UPI00029EDAF3|nr:restriction endonuclease subunit S [Rivularia sp. PCC 7116]AFY57399.1 restriction endonuclease S subunit [Rivularia sp. PCC 7116]